MAKFVRVGVWTLGAVGLLAGLVSSLTACPIATAGIFEAYMSIDGNRRQNTFFTDTKNITCTVDVRGASTRRPITTELLIRQEQVLNLQRAPVFVNVVLVYADFSGAGTQSLTLKPGEKDAGGNSSGGGEKPIPFPAGRFRCEVYLDGTLEASIPFNVDFAPCPPQLIENGAVCGGFYEGGRSCPRGGAGLQDSGIPEPNIGRCTCSGEQGSQWVCSQ